MAIARISPNGPMDDDVDRAASGLHFLASHDANSLLRVEETSRISLSLERLSADQLLLKKTMAICERHGIQFAQLSTIQRKFVTHYRCTQCGLLPLYHINLLHVKRVRCRKCGQLTGFTRKGKYGKLRKEIAFELIGENGGDVEHVS